MKNFLGIEYSRGATKTIRNDGPALAPRKVQEMFPNATWTFVTPAPFNYEECASDRFGENFKIQQEIYKQTPRTPHIMIGGDHSVNYGHFCAISDHLDTDDLCLVYIDAHLDMHTPETSKAQASGAPHGTNVRALLGDGDARWMTIPQRRRVLKPENLFYIATRSFEPAEIEHVTENNINISFCKNIKNQSDIENIISEIHNKIGNRPYVVSFDLDAINPEYFSDVLVPESGGLDVNMSKRLVESFRDAYSFEFVEYSPTGNQNCEKIVQDLINIVLD
jgi:arginase family enzyme